MKKIFISQTVLDPLFTENKATLEGDRLTIHSRSDQGYKLTPAYKFLKVADGSADKAGLVGKIYTAAELARIKADICADSALINDVPYEVEPGFIGMPEAAAAEAPVEAPAAAVPPAGSGDEVRPATAVTSPQPAGEASEVSEQELLTDYLLKVL